MLPTLAINAVDDPVVSASALSAYRDTVEAAGRAHLLATAAVDEGEHSRMHDAVYQSALVALEAWLDDGLPPQADVLQGTCQRRATDPGGCRFLAP